MVGWDVCIKVIVLMQFYILFFLGYNMLVNGVQNGLMLLMFGSVDIIVVLA